MNRRGFLSGLAALAGAAAGYKIMSDHKEVEKLIPEDDLSNLPTDSFSVSFNTPVGSECYYETKDNKIKNLRVYNRVLSDKEIQHLHAMADEWTLVKDKAILESIIND